jgi:hypothetical protein
MKYKCGTEVRLNDEVSVEFGPKMTALARIVAIGHDSAVPDIDPDFYPWAKTSGHLPPEGVVVQWINDPSQENPNPPPDGKYLTLSCLCCERFVKRGETT